MYQFFSLSRVNFNLNLFFFSLATFMRLWFSLTNQLINFVFQFYLAWMANKNYFAFSINKADKWNAWDVEILY